MEISIYFLIFVIDYKEVVGKDGKKYVFCSLEGLLMDCYGVQSIEEAERVAEKHNDEFVCHCPFCKEEGHTKHKLYIKDDYSVGHCFVCTRAFVNVTDTVKPEVVMPKNLSNFCSKSSKFILPQLIDPKWTIDRFNYEFDDFDEDGYNYLLSRHGFFKDLYKILGIKFWDGNVVIPFLKDGEPFYYQVRFATGTKSNIRYYLPKISPYKPPYIIERNESDSSRHKILIVEGIFDAIAALIQCPEFTPVAVLGSSISDEQINFIRNYAGYIDEIKIWMDETKISTRIANKIKKVIDYCPISIIKSYGPDPEEILKDRLKKGLPIQWISAKENNMYKKDV